MKAYSPRVESPMPDALQAGSKSPLSIADGLPSVPDSPPADPASPGAVTDSPPAVIVPPATIPPWRRFATRWPASVSVARFVAALVLAIIGFGIVLLLQGRNPIDAYVNMFSVTF